MVQAHADRRHLLLFGAAVVAIFALGARFEPETPAPATKVAANPQDNHTTGLGRFVVTARWGRTDGPRHTAPQTTATAAVDWSGELRIDCGQLSDVEPLAMDSGVEADGLGPVEVSAQGASVAVRSHTREGWDGLRAVVTACPEAGERGTTLTLRTQQRSIRARLDWSTDDFLSLPAGRPGQTIELRIAAQLDPRSIRGSRLTKAERGRELAVADADAR